MSRPDRHQVAQATFVEALRNADAPVPTGVAASRADKSVPATKRFAVYRNNVIVSLVDALAQRFPATQALVGATFFRAMARVFATDNPPRTRVMATYGDALPAFIETFPPVAALPYLADVARLEALLTQAYHAADAEPVGLDALAAVPPDALGDARLTLHPATRTLASRFPVVTLHAQNIGEDEGQAPDMTCAESALVTRPAFDVVIHRLPPGAIDFVDALGAGTFGEAVARAAKTPGFDLSASLATLFAAGAIAAVNAPMTDRESEAP